MTTPEVPPATPDSDGPATDHNPEALARKNRELLGELRKVKERFKVLESAATAAGVDLADPAGFVARREAEARAQAERESRVRDAVKDHLLDGGHRIGRKILSAVIAGAIGDSSVAIDEKGDLSGVPGYVDSWLSSLKGAGPKVPAPGLPITSKEPDPKSSLPSFTELANQGPAAVKAFQERYPDRYAELRDAHYQAMRAPTRSRPPR